MGQRLRDASVQMPPRSFGSFAKPFQGALGANFVPCEKWGCFRNELVNLSRTKRQYADIPQGSLQDEVQLALTEE